MDRRAQGDVAAANEALKQVVSNSVQLIEVSLAREFLHAGKQAGPLPTDVAVP
jgi:hypothetical protein